MQKIVVNCPFRYYKPQPDFVIAKIKEKLYAQVTAKYYTKRGKFLGAIEYFFGEDLRQKRVLFSIYKSESCNYIFQKNDDLLKDFLAYKLGLNFKRKLYMVAEIEYFNADTHIGPIQVYDDFLEKEKEFKTYSHILSTIRAIDEVRRA